MRYPPDMCPFYGMPDEPTPQDWADAAALAGPGGLVGLAATWIPFPAGWEIVFAGEGVQLVADDHRRDNSKERAALDRGDNSNERDADITPLGVGDVPEMMALVERARPGPLLPRTIGMGRYLGIRRNGALVAMAGERLRPPGWTEISAVCTDAEWRGHGFASRLTLAVIDGIRARGETPFLHAITTNANAIRLYEALGFQLRQPVMFKAARVPVG